MAKQSFSVGQVLTAAQMTSLQQTAMLGGAASAKTASYTLVAADAGTAISMSSTSATTITVNTGLFAAGDTVQITNLNTGVCTITAGTATVNTSASLALAQYESGTLDFTSASDAIFIKGAGSAAASGANWTLLNSGGTALTGAATITVSGISAKDKIMVIIDGASSASASAEMAVRFNTDSGTNYNNWGSVAKIGSSYGGNNYSGINSTNSYGGPSSAENNGIPMGRMSDGVASTINGYVSITGANSSGVKVYTMHGMGSYSENTNHRAFWLGGFYNSASTISSVSIVSGSGNFDAGTIYIYTSA
jgi:hypothetical protein